MENEILYTAGIGLEPAENNKDDDIDLYSSSDDAAAEELWNGNVAAIATIGSHKEHENGQALQVAMTAGSGLNSVDEHKKKNDNENNSESSSDDTEADELWVKQKSTVGVIHDDDDKDVEEVTKWLKEVVGLDEYITVFLTNGFRNIMAVKTITKLNLDAMNVEPADGMKLLLHIEQLRSEDIHAYKPEGGDLMDMAPNSDNEKKEKHTAQMVPETAGKSVDDKVKEIEEEPVELVADDDEERENEEVEEAEKEESDRSSASDPFYDEHWAVNKVTNYHGISEPADMDAVWNDPAKASGGKVTALPPVDARYSGNEKFFVNPNVT